MPLGGGIVGTPPELASEEKQWCVNVARAGLSTSMGFEVTAMAMQLYSLGWKKRFTGYDVMSVPFIIGRVPSCRGIFRTFFVFKTNRNYYVPVWRTYRGPEKTLTELTSLNYFN